MSTAFASIVSAVIAKLSEAPAVCDVIYRARGDVGMVPEQTPRAINVQFERAIADRAGIAGAPVDWNSTISVECFARGLAETGDVAVDPLLEAVYERLAQDPTLGGLIGDLVAVGIEADNTTQGTKTGWVRITYVADHRTNNSNLN